MRHAVWILWHVHGSSQVRTNLVFCLTVDCLFVFLCRASPPRHQLLIQCIVERWNDVGIDCVYYICHPPIISGTMTFPWHGWTRWTVGPSLMKCTATFAVSSRPSLSCGNPTQADNEDEPDEAEDDLYGDLNHIDDGGKALPQVEAAHGTVMLSYGWGKRVNGEYPNQRKVLTLAQLLQNHGFKVWIDLDHMMGEYE